VKFACRECSHNSQNPTQFPPDRRLVRTIRRTYRRSWVGASSSGSPGVDSPHARVRPLAGEGHQGRVVLRAGIKVCSREDAAREAARYCRHRTASAARTRPGRGHRSEFRSASQSNRLQLQDDDGPWRGAQMDRTGTRRIIVAQSVRGTGSRRVVEVEGATLSSARSSGTAGDRSLASEAARCCTRAPWLTHRTTSRLHPCDDRSAQPAR